MIRCLRGLIDVIANISYRFLRHFFLPKGSQRFVWQVTQISILHYEWANSASTGSAPSFPRTFKNPGMNAPLRIRLFFAYAGSMFGSISGSKSFVVTCKRCRREVPSGVKQFPFQSIVVPCPLCGELRRYLPSEVFLGKPHALVGKQAHPGQHSGAS